jgi:membrane fusion protein (multidrug efflux system)
VIGLTDIAPGTLISPGTAIATLDDLSVIRVDFDIPDRYLPLVREGQGISASTDAYPGERYAGRIARIDTRVNEQTRSVTARAELPNPGGRIRPGMAVRVAVEQGVRTAAAVPEAAVQYEGEGAFVYRIAPGARGATAQRIEVETGAVEGGYVEILSGLTPGDRVVGSGLNRIQPGAPIRLADQAAAGSAAPVEGAAR